MLTGYQVETVAFQTDGEILCVDCATKEMGPLTVAKIERGLTASYDARPISRYELDEISGEQQYSLAEEKLDEFLANHPAVTLDVSGRGRLIDRLAEKQLGECCGHCLQEIK